MSTAVTPLMTVKSILAGSPPRQHVLFQMPPEGVWYYRVEYRLWQIFVDGREAWSEWYHAVGQRTCLAWYKREGDAERAPPALPSAIRPLDGWGCERVSGHPCLG